MSLAASHPTPSSADTDARALEVLSRVWGYPAFRDVQADIVRTELEKTIARSAVSYLASWKSNAALDAKAHALGEALGFVYALRFCTKSGADAAWADSVLNGLTSSSQGAWTLTAAQADAAIAAINTKFSL